MLILCEKVYSYIILFPLIWPNFTNPFFHVSNGKRFSINFESIAIPTNVIRVVGRTGFPCLIGIPLPVHPGSLKRIYYSISVWIIIFLSNVSTAFKGTYFYILFVVTASIVVPCGGPKK